MSVIRSLLLAGLLLSTTRADTLTDSFQHPPASARPWVLWHWLQGAVSRDGLTADLVAMKQAGIGGAYLMSVTAPAHPPLYTPVALPLTSDWWDLVRHAAREADRLDFKLGLAVGDGFATAGGPWITPELSMQKVVWTETHVKGDQSLTITLPQPPTNENYYRDIAVLAFPSPPGAGPAPTPKITTSLPGFDAQFLAAGLPAEALAKAGDRKQQLRSDGPCWIQYEYTEPFTLRSLVIRQWDKNYGGVYHATRLKLEVSDDGITFHAVTRLEPPRHGWQDWDADYTFSIAPVTARYFRFIHDPAEAEPGSEDLDGAKWKPRLVLRGLALSSAPRLSGFEGKTGAVWRQSAATTSAQLPDALCVPHDRVLDLTAHLGPDGRLIWTPPTSGDWTILRFGHTSTGHRNETATAAPGLECDKFNPAAVRLQFDRWFGEAIRQLGPDLAGRVLKVLFVDSWETGSQNWTPAFLEGFKRERGFNPIPFLPTLAGIPVDSADVSERFLHHFRSVNAGLVNRSFFGTLAELAHAHGCEFSAESTAPTMMADALRHYGTVDLPTGEFWLRSPTHDKPNDIHDAISGAHVYGRNIVQAEAFTELRQQWDEHPALLKPVADHQFALGINRMVLHVFAHNPWLDRRPGPTLGTVGVQFNRDQTWWPEAGAWVQYLARTSALLQQGRPVADVAYFIGEELPSRALLPERRKPALPEGYAADSINADALLRLATAKDGRLVLPGGASYAMLVLPDQPVLTPNLMAKLRELANGGVILAGHRPTFTGALKGSVADQQFDQMEAAGRFPRGPLADLLAARGLAPDLLARETDGRPAAHLEWTHRSAPNAEIYFVSNQQAEGRLVEISLRGTGQAAELWQPVTGEMTPAPVVRENNGRTIVPLSLDPHGTVFVVLRPNPASEPALLPQAGSKSPQPKSPLSRGVPDRAGCVALPLAGPWKVTFDPSLGGPTAVVDFAALTDWTANTDPAIRYYSGAAVYSQNFEWTGNARRVWLDLGVVHNLARVTVNGIDCGVAWTPPYRVEISAALQPGANQLAIRLVNTWANRLIGDQRRPPGTSAVTWTTHPTSPDAKLLPAGLFGPVQLLEASDGL